MNDSLLLVVINLAEADVPVETDITLVVGGFLISGSVVSTKKYFKHNAVVTMAGMIERIKNEAARQENSQAKTVKTNFIHLKDARYYTPGQNPIPSNTGVFCRISLDAISGFSFGRLSVGLANSTLARINSR
ncbi:MAG TPA: hypothetical protein VGP12_03790 [Nitrosospira sp.]|jgi:hypothetical protein|nr:hypothetical protein [Nitrosospira sp.]